MSATHVSALRLANALAVRLDAAVPSPIHVSAERPAPPLSDDDIVIQVANGAERWGGVDRWPRMPTGEIALPDARVDAYCIYLWFGPGENRAALTLPPVELSELVK